MQAHDAANIFWEPADISLVKAMFPAVCKHKPVTAFVQMVSAFPSLVFFLFFFFSLFFPPAKMVSSACLKIHVTACRSYSHSSAKAKETAWS